MEEQNIPPQPVPQQPVMPPTPTPRSHLLPMILIGLIMLGIGLGGGYFLFANKVQNNSTGNTSQTMQSTPTQVISSPTVTVTAQVSGKIYTDTKSGISFKYPEGWDYKVFSGNEDIGFKPVEQEIPNGAEVQIPVDVQIEKENYNMTVSRLSDIFGSKNKEDLTVGSYVGVHIWGTVTEPGPAQGLSGGSFVLNKNGKSITFSYNVINGKNYMSEAKQMFQSVTFK